jgi:GT2 family glycosyltransferase
LVSAIAHTLDKSNPDLRMRLEAFGPERFSKTLKISKSVDSLSVWIEGKKTRGISSIEIKPLNLLAIAEFMIMKGFRYLRAKQAGLNLSIAYKQALAAVQPNANFAFRARYDNINSADIYPLWREIHEDETTDANAATELRHRLAGRTLQVGLIVAVGMDAENIAHEIRASLLLPQIQLIPISAGSFSVDAEKTAAVIEGCDFILPYDHQGRFAAGGMEKLVLALLDDPKLAAVFADSDTMQSGGERSAPRLKPPWDRELLWCIDYIRTPVLFRWQSEMAEAVALPGADRTPGYALAIAVMDCVKPDRLTRIPEILFHEMGEDAPKTVVFNKTMLEAHLLKREFAGSLLLNADKIMRVSWPVPRSTRVSILIPSRDNPGLLKSCIDSIRNRTQLITPEIIVADNDSVKTNTIAYLQSIAGDENVRVVPCPGPFNFSKINNDARRHATGDVIVLLNDDTQILSSDWLNELVSLALRPEVGAVGSMLLYPDGTIQHAGVLLGIASAMADHAFRYIPGDSPGYLNLLRCRRQVSAVTGACLAVSAAHFDALGGLDEALPVTLNDIDFCLRLRDRGLINIWTPWAVLEHWESKTRGIDHTRSDLIRLSEEILLFSNRWEHLLRRDPIYHPGLSDTSPDYRLAV